LRKRNQKEPFSSELTKSLFQTYGDSENLLNFVYYVSQIFLHKRTFYKVKIGDIAFQERGTLCLYCNNIYSNYPVSLPKKYLQLSAFSL